MKRLFSSEHKEADVLRYTTLKGDHNFNGLFSYKIYTIPNYGTKTTRSQNKCQWINKPPHRNKATHLVEKIYTWSNRANQYLSPEIIPKNDATSAQKPIKIINHSANLTHLSEQPSCIIYVGRKYKHAAHSIYSTYSTANTSRYKCTSRVYATTRSAIIH